MSWVVGWLVRGVDVPVCQSEGCNKEIHCGCTLGRPPQTSSATKLLQANGHNGHLFGDSLSYSDICTYGVFQSHIVGLVHVYPEFGQVTAPKVTPELVALLKSAEANPRVAKRIAVIDSVVAAVSS
ncbi:hypothetical protein GGF46_004013 [Coemansia sp. RSA 552]|nr:hypothetical protein GGF46_004013 [Coemansia sp. RSA 552]